MAGAAGGEGGGAGGILSRETQMSIEASSMFPGFRFSPTDVELISYYLRKKMEGAEKCVEVIPEVEICRHEPWELPAKSVIQSENEWFFFSARGRKYPNGTQSRRATELGYWKATGKERNVKSGSDVIGTKRTLVFHIGRAPKGERTEWIMHEYCMYGQSQDSLVVCRLRKNVDFRPNDNSNWNSVNTRHLSVSEGGIDQAGMSEMDKAAEGSRRCSSSHDSHSIEQFDSASESEQKLSNEGPLAESSSQQQEDSDKEEDFFAEILKDEIVKLDEASFSAAPEILSLTAIMPEAQIHAQQQQQQQPMEITMSQPPPSESATPQGTANRRIRLRKAPATSDGESSDGESSDESNIEEKSTQEETKLESLEEPPNCVVGVLSVRICHHRVISIIFIVLSLLVLLVSLFGDSQEAKRMTYGNLYKALWD